MDNGTISNATIYQFKPLDNLRIADESLKQEDVNPRISPEEESPGTQNQSDLVEFSQESVDLASFEEPRYIEETLLQPANTVTLTEVGMETGTTGLVGAALDNAINENEMESTVNTTGITNVATETEVVTEREETENIKEALEMEAAATAPTSPENIAAEAAVEPPAIIAETEQPPETELRPEEIAAPLEEQANRLNQDTSALNTTNGLTVGATNPEAETPGEAARNEQQILLQTVGSQLAQVIPPASIFSLVG